MGFVYVMEAGKYCKIGISEKSVEKRMQSIQTGCPIKIQRVWCSRNIPDERECERMLHDYFNDRKTSGEWFEVPFLEASVKADKVCRNGTSDTKLEKLEEEFALLEEENARLEEENARLEEENARLQAETGFDKYKQLKEEIRKLKEQTIAVERVKILEAENERLKNIIKNSHNMQGKQNIFGAINKLINGRTGVNENA